MEPYATVNREFQDRKAAMKWSTDPQQIMHLLFTAPPTSYAHVLEETAAARMSMLVEKDDTRNKTLGHSVIVVVLEMMRRNLGDPKTQGMGCDIFSRISETSENGGMPPRVFNLNIDDIEHVVKQAAREYRGAGVGWMPHANKTLQNIASFRRMILHREHWTTNLMHRMNREHWTKNLMHRMWG
ncbi:hypothetical protein T484DRAFT_1755865 [Baffinella frigidus]|nr:hypothetical protein T484DRAFT_1755865 [Cryptophyta sp. CCMP2293]